MAVGDIHKLPGFLTPVLTQLFFPKPSTTILACFSRGENTPERKFASTGDLTHNHQVMSLTCSPLNHQGRALDKKAQMIRLVFEKKENDDYVRLMSIFINVFKCFVPTG